MALVINSDYVKPAELTGYVREALADMPVNDLAIVDNLLPDTMIDDVEFRANITQRGLRRAAQFRSYDTEARITGRKGITRISGELPPMSEKRRLGEYDRLRLRKADTAIRDLIFNDAVELADALRTRIIMAKADAIYNGKVTLAENGLSLTADFGRAPGNTVTAATKWNVTGAGAADPINDQESWFATYRATNSGNPARAITSQRVMSALMRNDKIRAYCLPPGSTQGVVTRDQVNALFTSFGHPPFEIFDAQVEDAAGNVTRLFPDTAVVYVPGSGVKIGETAWGTTAEALEPDYGIDETDAPGIVVGSYIDADPVARWTKASGIGMPLLLNANATMVATVL
ncbi:MULTISPECIES: major capsid protein [Nocardia]|uniref:Major capsid protein E n=1 Tax=Nocardia nova TaxID=37330 RepID=A0A2T2Z8A3_9NOCA|nr:MULTISPECIES: major capsid protein [Nocardia]PSR63993.1 major capsid protein E [Nocardia nova]